MSYSFREKPRTRLSDRLRGKSGDELFQELRQELDQDRKMFFDSNPNWGFSPAGPAFPRRHVFDDEDDPHFRGKTDLKAHLDDLANRHPEFADHLRSPPGWVSDFRSGGSWGGRKRSGSRDGFFGDNQDGPKEERGEKSGENQQSQQEQTPTTSSSAENSNTARRDSLNQHGLRNTDPEIGQKGQAAAAEVRNQRSMSAPPDSNRTQMNPDKPQRFVSKIEINPVNPATGQTADSCGKPPMAPPKQNTQQQHQQPSQQNQQHPQSQQPQHKQSTVRHIPIYVEGRDEPVLPKNIDQDYAPPPQFRPPPPSSQFTAHHQFQPQNAPRKQSQQQQAPPPPQQQTPHHPNQETAQPAKQQQHDQTDSAPKPAEPKVNQNDPIYRVQLIQKEVNELRKQIDSFNGKSRSDKEYVFLDEMLTRNLIKLDDICTEGKENIRAARKDAIRSIQQCISVLESKVPVPQEQKMETEDEENCTALVPVERQHSKEASPVLNDNNVQKMDTAESQNPTSQESQPANQSQKDDKMVVDTKREKSPTAVEQKPESTEKKEENPNEIKC